MRTTALLSDQMPEPAGAEGKGRTGNVRARLWGAAGSPVAAPVIGCTIGAKDAGRTAACARPGEPSFVLREGLVRQGDLPPFVALRTGAQRARPSCGLDRFHPQCNGPIEWNRIWHGRQKFKPVFTTQFSQHSFHNTAFTTKGGWFRIALTSATRPKGVSEINHSRVLEES